LVWGSLEPSREVVLTLNCMRFEAIRRNALVFKIDVDS
jgi:hypothetical protein